MAAKNKVSFILPFYAKAALILISIVLLFIILQAASGLLIPMLFAVLVAILLLQPATYMERNLKMGRFLSSLPVSRIDNPKRRDTFQLDPVYLMICSSFCFICTINNRCKFLTPDENLNAFAV